MIPYFQIDALRMGPIILQMWGLWVSAGILAAILLSYKLAQKYFLSVNLMLDLGVWGIIGGLIGARFGHVFFYDWSYYAANLNEIWKFWHGGASSLGGFIGAGLAISILILRRGIQLKDLLPYLDIGAFSLWLGWGIGRIGCFFIHDHPGRLTSFFLAVNFPSGARHDLGLYESLCALLIFIVYSLLFKKLIKRGWGLVAISSFLTYAVARFCLDFLRSTDLPISDPRYLYLTPAQWGMATIVFLLTIWLVYSKITERKKEL